MGKGLSTASAAQIVKYVGGATVAVELGLLTASDFEDVELAAQWQKVEHLYEQLRQEWNALNDLLFPAQNSLLDFSEKLRNVSQLHPDPNA